jgi:protein-tyrosine phosphatase
MNLYFKYLIIFLIKETLQFNYYYNDTEQLCKQKNIKQEIYNPKCLNILLVNNRDKEVFTNMPLLSQITKRIFLGNELDAKNYDLLKYHNISYIVNSAKKQINYYENEFEYIHTLLTDYAKSDLIKHMYKVLSFMNKRKGNFFVHCFYGKSRSASFVIAYLMYKKKWRYKKAFDFVKKRRKYINPNKGFKKQLQLLDAFFIDQGYNLKKLKGKTKKIMTKLYEDDD